MGAQLKSGLEAAQSKQSAFKRSSSQERSPHQQTTKQRTSASTCGAFIQASALRSATEQAAEIQGAPNGADSKIRLVSEEYAILLRQRTSELEAFMSQKRWEHGANRRQRKKELRGVFFPPEFSLKQEDLMNE